ncbi:MAG: hypothetical protein N2560_01645 [Ignavibacteria bacterium]|nr:hypothetical protein [Ignavibacteria bacterium]
MRKPITVVAKDCKDTLFKVFIVYKPTSLVFALAYCFDIEPNQVEDVVKILPPKSVLTPKTLNPTIYLITRFSILQNQKLSQKYNWKFLHFTKAFIFFASEL